jgi:quercetin dioxygenase-like cupin family protein
MRSPGFVGLLAAASLVVAGCSAPATTAASPTAASPTAASPTATAAAIASAKAEGAVTVNLGDGKIPALPKGILYVQYNALPQPAGGTLTHAHIGGFVYGVEGTTQLIADGKTTDLKANEAAFVAADASHTHNNLGTTTNLFYYVSIRPNAARTAAPIFPGQKELFAGPDLPAMADGIYSLGLRSVTVQPNGRTAAHMHGGLETIVVLDGSVELRVKGVAVRTLAKGEGASINADTALQVWNRGLTPARFLAFFVTADGKTFSTDVDASP